MTRKDYERPAMRVVEIQQRALLMQSGGANITATWESGDEILVVVDGQVSTLTLTDGAGTSSATFEGTISHTNALTATTPLVCYGCDLLKS